MSCRLRGLLLLLLLRFASGRIIRLGGTLPLSSTQLTEVERASLQGLQLLAARLNQSTPFNGPHNLPLTLHVQVEDDHGNSDKAAEIYARMLQNQEVDFLFGLHSSEMFKVAVDASNSAGVLTLLGGGVHLLGVATAAQLHSPWTFSPDVQVQDRMSGVLELVQQQTPPASSVALVWDAGSPFDMDMCAGASSHARRLGLAVLDNMSVAEQAIMPQMRQLKAAGPDLLIACGNLRSAEEVLISASTLGFIPRGIALTAMSTREAVRSIGAHLANYVMSPLVWEPSSQSCPVFGSSQDFADSYRAKFREEPLPVSASAAAGGIALLAAVQSVSSLDQAAVREALLTREQQTCYGRLSFSQGGVRRNPTTLVQQVLPLEEDQPKMDRWTSAQIVTIGAQQPLAGWPLPTWVQKEADVYPCSPGQAVVLDIGGNATTCVKCPAGRFRTPRSVECEDCQPGTYGMESGMSQCDVCPAGAACPGNSEVFAKPGYYRLPSASLQEGTFVRCYPKHLCLGENRCAEAHKGILCQSCDFGFSKPLWGLKRETCTKCPSRRVTIGSIALTISVYVFYIWLIVKGTKSASQSMRALPSVIIKIGVNYMQFAGTAFEATNFKEMVWIICGERSAAWIFPLIALPERLQYPLTTLMSLDCILPRESSVRPYQVEILVGLTLMPLAFFIMTLFAFVRKDCIGQRLVPWLQRHRARRRATRRSREAELGVIQEAAHEAEDAPPGCRITLSPSSGASPRRDVRSPTSPASPSSRRGDDYTLTPMSAYGMTSPASTWRNCRTEEDSVERPHVTKVLVNSVATRFVNAVIVMSFVLHPVVVRILVVGFECEELDVLRHRHDLGVECKSTSHMQWLGFSTVGLVVYGIGVPVALFIALFRVRKRLFRAEVRKRFGFLYNGFELKYYYFESVYMFRKVMILLFFTAPTMYVRMVLMLFTSFGFILLHVYSGPFDNRSYLCLDRLEALNLLALTVTVSARLIFDIRQELSGEFFEDFVNHWTMDILLVAGPLLAHSAFVCFALWSLFRNTVLKHLLLKADIWPEKMSRFQKCLLGLEVHKQKAAFDEDERGLWIDTSSLSKQERHYMFVAMCDTLHRYMDSSKRVHPGDVTAAVQEALIRCRRARRKRAVRLEQLDREFREQRQHGRRGCLSRLIRWQRLMNVSLYGADRQNELPEQEPGCIDALLKWAVADSGHRVRGLPQKALHMEMEHTHEFLAEEFYDALLPVWQEITEGRGPQLSPRYEDHGAVRSMSQLMPQRHPDLEAASENSANPDGEKDEALRSISGSLQGSSMRLEALLGRTQPLQAERAESGGLERFLCRARSGCRIELPDLLRAHDELMAENLHLRKENEALRARPTSPQQISPGTRSGYASPKSHRTEVSPSARLPSRSPSEAASADSVQVVQVTPDGAVEEEEEAEIPEEGARLMQRPSHWRDQVPPASPSIMSAAAAAFMAATSIGRSPKVKENRQPEETQPCATPTASPQPARAQDVRPRSPQRLTAPPSQARASSLGPAERGQAPSKALLRLPVPSAAERARSMCAEARNHTPNSAGSASPWRTAMRPAKCAAWLKQTEKDLSNRSSVSGRMVPFEFMGAARPTHPSAWPQVE